MREAGSTNSAVEQFQVNHLNFVTFLLSNLAWFAIYFFSYAIDRSKLLLIIIHIRLITLPKKFSGVDERLSTYSSFPSAYTCCQICQLTTFQNQDSLWITTRLISTVSQHQIFLKLMHSSPLIRMNFECLMIKFLGKHVFLKFVDTKITFSFV